MSQDDGNQETGPYVPKVRREYNFSSRWKEVFDQLNEGEIPRFLFENGEPMLYTAARQGFAEVIQRFCHLSNLVNEQRERTGRTPLMVAAKMGHAEVVRILLSQPNVIMENLTDMGGNTALHLACRHNNLEVVRLLLKSQVHLNLRNRYDETSLMVACESQYTTVAMELVKAGADVDAEDSDGDTALIMACSKGNVQLAQCLIENEADVNHMNKNYNTPLSAAGCSRSKRIVTMLIDAGASLQQAPDGAGTSLLMRLVFPGMSDIINDRFDKQSLHHVNDLEQSVAKFAVETGATDVLKVLVENGVDCENVDNDGNNVLIHAIRSRAPKALLELLLESKANVNQVTKNGQTPLLVAATCGYDMALQLLCQHGADVLHASEDGNTALLYACMVATITAQSIQSLCEMGSHVNHVNSEGYNALMRACKADPDTSVIKALLSYGADHKYINPHGETALYYALFSRKGTVTMQCLLDAGAVLNEPAGSDLLYECLRLRSKWRYADLQDTVRFLVQSGVDLNRKHDARDPQTALGLTILYADTQLLEILLEAGADVTMETNLAIQLDFFQGFPLLLRHGAAPLVSEPSRVCFMGINFSISRRPYSSFVQGLLFASERFYELLYSLQFFTPTDVRELPKLCRTLPLIPVLASRTDRRLRFLRPLESRDWRLDERCLMQVSQLCGTGKRRFQCIKATRLPDSFQRLLRFENMPQDVQV